MFLIQHFSRRWKLAGLATFIFFIAGTGRAGAALCKNVLAYYPFWNQSTYNASQIPYYKLTHICHAFIGPNADGSLNVDPTFLEPVLISNAHAQGVSVLVSVGGSSRSTYFSAMAASPTANANFAVQITNFCATNGYDGVDLDWEFPTSNADKANLNTLVQNLRNQFNNSGHPGWFISAAVSPSTYYAQYFDLTTLKGLMNFFNLMVYDYHGSWTNHSGHNAPLFQASLEPPSHSGANGKAALDYYTITRGVPKSQINYGLAFYGYQFNTNNLYGSCSPCTTNYLSYVQVASMVGNGWTRTWDASADSPWLSDGNTCVTYDDPQSIGLKASYALNTYGVGGVFMWSLDMDYQSGSQPLLDQMFVQACGTLPGPTPAPGPPQAAPAILSSLPYPSPNPLQLGIYLQGAAQSVELEIYSSAMLKVLNFSFGLQPAGWSSLALPASFLNLARGIYFYRLRSRNGNSFSSPAYGRLVVVNR